MGLPLMGSSPIEKPAKSKVVLVRDKDVLDHLWHFPQVKGKTRLNILVMITPLFHGIGPHHFSRSYTWRYNGLIVSTDPVAADATGARIIQAKRDSFFGEKRPISPPPVT